MLSYQKISWLFSFMLCSCILFAQNGSINGIVVNASNNTPLEGATIRLENTEISTTSDANGVYELTGVSSGTHILVIEADLYSNVTKEIVLIEEGATVTVPTIALEVDAGIGNMSSEDLIPTVTLSDSDVQSDRGGTQNVSGLLTASRDAFVSAAAFTFGPMRFRIRGYDSENSTVLLNSLPMNDLETGRPVWSTWGGLNDVLRNRENVIGMGDVAYDFGGVGGSTNIDMRPTSQRKQFRVSYATSNRSYAQRVMATYSTGLMAGGWAVSASASYRFRFSDNLSYRPGALYSAASYFVAVEKQMGDHTFVLTGMGAPQTRGKTMPTVAEAYDLAGSPYYNPNWGYQTSADGSRQIKRNARVAEAHQPLIILNHDWDINDKSALKTAVGYQFGINGSTALDWYNAADPRPDYYRYLPSYYEDENPALAAALTTAWQTDESLRQVDWDGMYEANRNSYEEIQDANGITGNTVTGNRAKYIVEERRYDNQRFNLSTTYQNALSSKFTLNAGLQYQWSMNKNYRKVQDLLGADFYLDIDQFAERDSSSNAEFYQNDIETPNRILQVGDIFGHFYTMNVHQTRAWAQGTYTTNHLDFFVAARGTSTTFWRDGKVRNGKFPEGNESFGKSEIQQFFNYDVKGGITYKVDGRNYAFVNASYATRAPFARNAFLSPRTRNQVIDDLQSERIYSFEAGYRLQAPNIKLSLTGYYTKFEGRTDFNSFYLDNAIRSPEGDATGGFVNYVMRGIDQRHMGIELGVDAKIPFVPGLSLVSAVAFGEYIYTSRPTVSVYLDNTAEVLFEDRTVYWQNFRVAGTPQAAFTAGLSYRAPQYWFLNVNFNYTMRNWVDINADRRTLAAVDWDGDGEISFQQNAIEPGSDLWQEIIYQEELNGAFTVDIFGGKSFRIKKEDKSYFLFFNVGVSNILNNQNIVTGGFEQFRFDYRDKDVSKFPPKYFNGFGINYFASATLSF